MAELDSKTIEKEQKDYKLEKSPAESETGRTDSSIRLNLTDDERGEFITLIKEELRKIIAEYSEAEYFDKIEKADNEYEGIKEATDFPFTDASNRKLLLTTMLIEIVSTTARRQTCFPSPMVLLEKEEEIDETALRDREDSLDYQLRKDIDYEPFSLVNYQTACKYGASVTAIELDNDVETFLYRETYTQANIDKFTKKYAKKLFTPDSKEFREWQRILAGESITKIENEVTEVYYGPKLRIVPLNKFFARLKIKEFRRHRVIAEQMDFVWMDIERRMETGFYDEDAVIDLKMKNPDYEKGDYKIYQAIVKKYYKGRLGRFVITFDDRTEIILRAIFYPYKHNKVYYVSCCAFPKTNSWLGYSFTERLADMTEIANAFLNSAINEFTLGHMPTILCDDPEFDGSRTTIQNLSVLTFKKGTQFTPLKFEYTSMDRVQFMSWIQNFSELIIGVSASLMSGRETPGDPRAPASKTALKYQASSLRIEDIISSLQRADIEIIEQIDKLSEQYLIGEDGLKYWTNNEEKVIPAETFNKKIRYIMHGTRLSFDKRIDFQIATQIMEILKNNFPDLWQDIEVRFRILSIMLNNLGGAVGKNKKYIIAPMKQKIDMKNQMETMVKNIKQKIASGEQLTPEEQAIAQRLQQMQGQGGAPQIGAPGPGGPGVSGQPPARQPMPISPMAGGGQPPPVPELA